jgi:hypothetical protein
VLRLSAVLSAHRRRAARHDPRGAFQARVGQREGVCGAAGHGIATQADHCPPQRSVSVWQRQHGQALHRQRGEARSPAYRGCLIPIKRPGQTADRSWGA